ncbi:MAG: SRPBCC family protein [Dehalococcoidia bacterium]|nr:SRPBCC family protein [Dehalococcoidia bacterium]
MPVASVRVHASPETTFAYLSDLSQHREWTAEPSAADPVDDAPVAKGKRYSSNNIFMGKPLVDNLEVTVVEPSRQRPGRSPASSRFGFIARGPQAVVDYVFTLRADGGDTVVERTTTVVEMPAFLKLIFPLIYAFVGRKSDENSLQQFKARVEAIGK